MLTNLSVYQSSAETIAKWFAKAVSYKVDKLRPLAIRMVVFHDTLVNKHILGDIIS